MNSISVYPSSSNRAAVPTGTYTTVLDVLAGSNIFPAGSGAHLQLPQVQLDRKLYREVNKTLQALGGRWTGGNTQAFVFPTDPTAEINRMVKGETTINPAKDYQFFPTPNALADLIAAKALIRSDHDVLEPSAGDGALIKAIWRIGNPYMHVDAYEAWERNRDILNSPKFCGQIHVLGNDCLVAEGSEKLYDRIVANPPFTKNQDIVHVLHYMSLLKPGGRLVSVMSTHWQFASDGPSVRFRKILDNNPGCMHVEALPENSFKESNTGVNTCLFIFQD